MATLGFVAQKYAVPTSLDQKLFAAQASKASTKVVKTATLFFMNEALKPRTFKTEWFTKAAKKAEISDADLCKAIEQVKLGQCDDLGGGVLKKRLNLNLHRSIIIANAGKFWIFTY